MTHEPRRTVNWPLLGALVTLIAFWCAVGWLAWPWLS